MVLEDHIVQIFPRIFLWLSKFRPIWEGSTIAAKKGREFLRHCVVLDQLWKQLQWWPPPPPLSPQPMLFVLGWCWTQAYSNVVLGGRGEDFWCFRLSSFFGYWEIFSTIFAAIVELPAYYYCAVLYKFFALWLTKSILWLL